MRYKLFLLFWLMPVLSIAQFSITIQISDIRNNNGKILLELSNENQEQIAVYSVNISDNKCVIVIDSLKKGKYSFRFIHDENRNDKLETNWLGIPKEGFGFSNNPSMTFGPPSFEETIFELRESIFINCKPKYY
jgi:uncharacterized protein (DUF2141 family)